MEYVYGIALFIAAWVIYGLYARLEHLEQAIRTSNATASRALELIADLHGRQEFECEIAREARRQRRENEKIGLFTDNW